MRLSAYRIKRAEMKKEEPQRATKKTENSFRLAYENVPYYHESFNKAC